MSRARLEKEEKRAMLRTALSRDGEEDVRPGVITATKWRPGLPRAQ